MGTLEKVETRAHGNIGHVLRETPSFLTRCRWDTFNALLVISNCVRTCVRPVLCTEHPGEAVVPREEHAGPSPPRSLHHRQTRSVLHGAVDRRIRIPEPDQVRDYKHTHRFDTTNPIPFRLCIEQKTCEKLFFIVSISPMTHSLLLRMQATRGHQSAEGGHRATEEAACQEEASKPCVSLPLCGLHLWTQAEKNQGGQRQRLRPLPQALLAPAVSTLK